MLHGRETGTIKRLPHGEFIEVHEPLSQEQLYTLTAHEQYEPVAIGATVDENGVERKVKATEKLRAKISGAYFGEDQQIPKRPSRSTRRSRAATATTDHQASPRPE